MTKLLPDLSRREFTVLLALLIPTVILGLFPNTIINDLHISVSTTVYCFSPIFITTVQKTITTVQKTITTVQKTSIYRITKLIFTLLSPLLALYSYYDLNSLPSCLIFTLMSLSLM